MIVYRVAAIGSKAWMSVPRLAYRPLLASNKFPLVTSTASSHGPFTKAPPGCEGWENWKSWKDVPDYLIATSSKRDPNNPIYSNPQYIKLRKQQIWMQLPNGVPVWLRMGTRDYVMYYGIIAGLSFCFCVTGYAMYGEIYKKFYPD